MVKLQTSVLLKTTLFWLNCHYVFGQDQFPNNLDITVQNNGECQTIEDCSAGALECRKDIMNESISHCIYPDNLNDVPFNDIIVPGNDTINENPTNVFGDINNTTTTANTCNSDEECPSKKCISGQCQIELNTLPMNSTILNDTVISQNNTLSLNCTSNEDCPSHNCVSGQCQMDLEQAALNICNADHPGSICGKLEGEKCEKDSDCMTSFCDKRINTCAKRSDRYKNRVSPAAAVIIISTGICIGFVLVVLIIRKEREEKAKKVQEQYTDNVQQPMYVIYSEDYDVPTYTY